MVDKIEIDIIIVSFAQTYELKDITLNCIHSLMNSENCEKINFNVIIIESQKSMEPYQYPNSKTIYPNISFGYHQYMNIGIEMTSSPYICICNNDLVFHPLWATELLKPMQQFADVFSASPVCPTHHKKMGFKLNDGLKLGYRIRYELSGWCILMKRDLLRLTGKLDENYIFWYADNDYINTLFVLKLRHVLVTSAFVDHLESKTLKKQSKEREEELTEKEITYFEKKWKHRLGDGWQPIK